MAKTVKFQFKHKNGPKPRFPNFRNPIILLLNKFKSRDKAQCLHLDLLH